MRYFLGVDIGNTKSHALIADEHGQCIGFGSAGPGSWEAIGWLGAREVLHLIVGEALAQAGRGHQDITGAGFGYAGYDWPEDRPGHVAIIESLGLDNARYTLDNDTIVGLVAGAAQGWGVVVIAGTSNNCRGRDKYGRVGRVTGSGSLFGEYGGATEIVSKAIQAVAADWSCRGPRTVLSAALVSHVGAVDQEDLFAGLIRDRYKLSAGDAPIVFAVAEQGDEVAQGIIDWAGQSLGDLANGVIRQLDLSTERFDVVMSGSLYKGGERLIEPMRRTILSLAPRAEFVRLTAPPVVGGVLLGLEAAGLETIPVRGTLLESANQLMLERVASGEW